MRFNDRSAVRWVAVAMSLFQIYTSIFGSLDAYMQRTVHLFFGLVLVFLIYPPGAGKKRGAKSRIGQILALAGVIASLGYVLWNYEYLTVERFAMVTPLTPVQTVLGIVLMIVTLMATGKMTGLSLFIVVLGFFFYVFVGPFLPGLFHSSSYTLSQVLDFMYFGTGGIFGIPLGVSATDIAIFIVFGAFMVKAGVGNFLFDIGAALVGKSSGGIGKVAVIASAFMGMITGSGTANVATVGTLTIPMMKKAGYKPYFAGAIEAAASTGGQIMPPVMGVTAFVIAAFTGIPYITICKFAILPAILYFASIYFSLDLEAGRLRLTSYRAERTAFDSFKQYGHTIIPVIILVYLLVTGFSPGYSAGMSLVGLVLICEVRKKSRLTIQDCIASLENGAKGTLVVMAATAAAGIIVGSLDLTSLGNRLTGGLMDLTHGRLLSGLILTMLISIVLGMGMPTTPAYVLQVALVIPALISLGVPLYIAHFYAFYFCCLSLITPPVAITAYAAAGIAGANIWTTGWKAFQIALPSYVVPYAFAYAPSLLLNGPVLNILLNFFTALLGVWAMGVATIGHWRKPVPVGWRAGFFLASLLLIAPFWQASVVGILFLGVYYLLRLRKPISPEKAGTDLPLIQ